MKFRARRALSKTSAALRAASRQRAASLRMPSDACVKARSSLFRAAKAVSEAARAFGNFSRDEDARRAMRRLGVVEALVLLLGHPARDVVFAAAGALINAAVDGRDVLWEHKAHEELVAVVRRAGVQDLDLAAVACKALHNLLLDATTGATPELLGGATHGRLLDTLGELVAVADDDDFLAAAGALRTILEE